MAHELEQSRLERAGEYERVQKKAFTNWVNSHLVKAGQKVTDIYEDFKDGSKLLLLLELLTGNKLAREKGKMRVHKLQNVQNALDYLQKVKRIKLVNIRNDEIVDGNPKLILGLLWTLILHFQISEGLQEDPSTTSRPTSPQEISTKAIKDMLLQWAKMATEGYEGVDVNNFHSSWRDGKAFCAIIDRYRPDLLDFDDCDPDQPLENLERAFKVAEEELDIIRIVDPEDVCVPRPDDKAIMTYVSFLHQAFPDMPPARKIRGPEVTPEDYSKLYDDLKSWIDDKKEQASNRDFPNTVKELKKEIGKLEKVKGKEMPAKKSDMASLAEMHEKLEAHKKKRNAEGAPADKDLAQLQADWDSMEEAVNDCHKAMQDKLKRLEDLDVLAQKLNSECDRHSPAVDELEGKVKELEEKSTSMTPSEASKIASNLTHEIEQLLAGVSSLEPGVEKLKKGNHPEADPIQQRVSTLKSSLESLLPRVKNASSAATEAQEVVAMENSLEELEAWLVSSGKFSSNQHILRQIQEHRTFQMERLSKAEKDFNRMANSPPPPGMEDKVKEVNERFKRVVKQTDDRLSGLEPIVDEVLEFDSTKNSLEEWCVEQQETLDQLPLLEVTEDKLREQQQECHTLLESLTAKADSLQRLEELAEKFLRDTEPVQSIADRYARKIRSRVQRSSEENQEPSLGEQAGVIQSQFEWLKGRVTERDTQIVDLLDKLSQFNQQYDRLREFVDDGNRLLASEKPVGDNATRVQEQMDTCQDFRSQIASKQPAVEAMLSLGREILAEPNTSSASDGLMQKLTGFIQDWSDLQLNWQNWFDELHAGVEQSKNLSDQLKKFENDMRGLAPALAKLFPATVSVKSLDKDLQRLQNKFNSDVLRPYEAQKEVYQKLKEGLSLLPDSSEVDQVFKKFEELSETVESRRAELSGVREEVGKWWTGCEGATRWLGDTEGDLITHKPLASSLDIIQKQKTNVQALVDGIEEQRECMEATLKALTELAQHKQLLVPSPIDSYRMALDRRWKALNKEIETRIELSGCGKEYLSSYANNALPFTTWLKGVESRITGMTTLPRPKDLLLLERDEMKAFYDEVKVHGETLTQIEIKGSSFLGSSKTYQSQLLAYQRRVDSDQVSSLPKDFVDPRTEDLTSQEVNTEDFEGNNYQNGIRVVAGNSASLRRRFDALNAKVKQHQHLVEEGVARRAEFDGCLATFVDPLSELEGKCDRMELSGESQPLKVQEKVETVRTLEVECMALEPKLQDAQAKYDLLADLCQEEEEGRVPWEGEDEALAAKEDAERRHKALLDKLRNQREILNDELSNAQAFHGAFENFLSWLRKTERKTQRDEPIQLEDEDLKAGLKHLKETAADIAAHKPVYETMCGKCSELIARGVQDAEELQEKLDNVQQRWNALQFVSDDIEVIEDTIPKLEAFESRYKGVSSDLDDLLNRIDSYSVSAISTDALALKSKGLQDFSGEVDKERTEFDGLLNSCGLLETPFDQSKFESNVNALKDKMNQCEKRVSDKKSELKALDRKVRPMEDMFAKFRSWLEGSRESLAAFTPPPSLAEEGEREKTIRQAQSIVEDVDLHKGSLERLEAAMSAVLPLLDEPDQDQLKAQLEDLTNQYNCHAFNSEGYLVERWAEGKEAELVAMAPTAVQPPPLQDQLREVQDFLSQVDKYSPKLEDLSSQASMADPTGETVVGTKMAELQERYQCLKVLGGERQGLEADYLPIVQQYESSRGAWQDLLCGWEDKVEKLPAPSATPEAIQAQLEELKAFQQNITDHEPEFVSLKREINKLCNGPDAESAHFDKLLGIVVEGCPVGRDLPRPGQAEQDRIIADYEERLEALKRKLSAQSETLNSQLERGKEFETTTSDLSSWLDDLEGSLDDFKIRDPKSDVIKAQQQKCQSVMEAMAGKEEVRESLVPLLASLTSQIPEGNSKLQSKLDDLNKRWSDLLDQLGQSKANLDSAFVLASRHEGSMKSLNPWVPETLERLENLGPPPTEPDKVQKLKADIEGLKVEYNSLAPAYASCVENGQSLAGVCEEGQPRSDLEGNVADLQDKWERLKRLFGDLNEKLTAALVQTQEFQGIASDLERWMSGMDDQLRQQDRIAARCKLIEPQIKGFKPILSDIEAYSGTLEQATSVGQSLMAESEDQEKSKIEARLSSMADHFSRLRENSQKRMSRLEDALKMATRYEEQSNRFDKWLLGAEGSKSSIGAFTIASQPLKAQLEKIKEHMQDMESHKAELDTVTEAEQSLFDTEMSSIELCEEQLSADTSLNKSVLPDWFDRPGAPEAVQVGADLRNRYDRLGVELVALKDEGTQLLQKVLTYEEEHNQLKDWLTGEKESIASLSPLTITISEIRQQLKEVEDMGRDFKNKEESLESVNARGTELVEGCKDELSGASGRLKLSDLNDLWGDSLSALSDREGKLKQGLALAETYQSVHDGFDEWLSKCEDQVSLPIRLEGDPREIRRQLDDMKVLTEEIERHQPQLEGVVTAGHTLEAYPGADSVTLPDVGYTTLEDRYNALKQQVNDRVSALTDALGQVSNLRDQLDGLLEKLQKMKGKLKGHEPAHVIPADVEKQIKELMLLDKAYGELAPAISKCREEGRNFVSVENGSANNEGMGQYVANTLIDNKKMDDSACSESM